jgi:Carboxypeptidase regulatory-like domain
MNKPSQESLSVALNTREFTDWMSRAIVVLCLTVATVALRSQTASATISGRITDNSGAVVAGAVVELTSVERGTTTTAPTNSAGLYTFPSVQPGTYRLVARSSGFKQAEAQNLIVEVGSQLEQNFQLDTYYKPPYTR